MTQQVRVASVEEIDRLVAVIQSSPSPAAQEAALEQLTSNPDIQRIIGWLANRFQKTDLYDDLVQEGYVCLLEVVHLFDASRGVKFTTYLTTCAARRMLKYVASEKSHFGNEHRKRFYPDDKSELVRPGDTRTSLENIAVDLGTTAGELAELERIHYLRYQEKLGSALHSLTQRQEQAVVLRFFDDEKPSAIATRLSVSRPRVTALIQDGLSRMRDALQVAA